MLRRGGGGGGRVGFCAHCRAAAPVARRRAATADFDAVDGDECELATPARLISFSFVYIKKEGGLREL